ncbi:MAG: hypothetical protein QNI99_13110 [Woeseiaceae bacterium]|nr:hypothetical protein [Woeseiaceae bacterium]
MIILGRALTILIGAMPATYLSLTAVFGVIIGVMALADGETGASLLVLWGSAGIYGTLSLWAAGLGSLRLWVVVGLAAGSAAILPLTSMAFSSLGFLSFSDLWTLILIGPLVVAIAWLGVATFRAIWRPHAPMVSLLDHLREVRAGSKWVDSRETS